MSKSISSGLQTAIQAGVTTLATCVQITRRDGKPYYITSHDEDIEFEGHTFSHSVPCILGAFSSGSQLSIDNTTLTLFADETYFLRAEFERGLFDFAECIIFKVDYTDLSLGKVTMRRGWFGKTEINRNNVISVTVTGLLKVLDFETGREYQPTCDADLGDARCRVAINQKQIRSSYNYVRLGDWVYSYDTSLMTALTVVNGNFSSGGDIDPGNPIPGWTQGSGGSFYQASADPAGDLDPVSGGALYGGEDATATDSGFEHYVYQDIDVTSLATDIDAGKLSVGMFALLGQTVYLLDPVRIRIELLDSDGEYVSHEDSRWITFETPDEWFERALVMPLFPNTRTVRLFIYFKKEEGVLANGGADNVRLYYWDHTVQTPYDDVVHRVARIVTWGTEGLIRVPNHSFEAALVSNANNPTISSWTPSGWWSVVNSVTGINPHDSGDDAFLFGGDDGGATQQTYTLTQTRTIVQCGMSPSRVALGKYVGKLQALVAFQSGGTTSTATVKVEFLNAGNTVIATYNAMNDENFGVIVNTWEEPSVGFAVPSTTAHVRVTLAAKSPIGSGAAKVAFDNVRLWFIDAERPKRNDAIRAVPLDDVTLDTTVGGYTVDGDIIWKAMPVYLKYDVVASVTDLKTFIGTNISGVDGTYETGRIRWISGQNAGLSNIVRVWETGTKTLKLYFKQPYAIAVGDRFIYERSCGRRFTQDCSTIFENQINFRGFPHLPGKLRDATATENAAG